MTFNQTYKKVEHIDGWFPKEDAQVLYDETIDLKGTIVEIGCWKGRSSKFLSLCAPESTIYSIDPCEGKHIHAVKGVGYDVRPELFENMVNTKNWELLMTTSLDASKLWDKPIDVLFIDGMHDYDNVLLDSRLWIKHLKKSGVVIYHDYWDVVFEDIALAVDAYGFNGTMISNSQGGKTSCGLFRV